ncbi:MAG: Ig-like domain-containing protein [Bacteroidales bacterium]|nr:Ig-like domain-containing protein [Bacteroidales bacterium]
MANPIIKAEIEAPATNQPYATPVYVANAAQIGQPTPTITLSDDTVSVAENATETITATTTPNAFVVDWSSSDEAVATVAGGVITGVAAGSATITAKITVDGYNYTATCAVTVTA